MSEPQCGVASRATHDALGLRYKGMYLPADHPFSVYRLQLAKRYTIYKMVRRPLCPETVGRIWVGGRRLRTDTGRNVPKVYSDADLSLG